MNPINSLKVNQ